MAPNMNRSDTVKTMGSVAPSVKTIETVNHDMNDDPASRYSTLESVIHDSSAMQPERLAYIPEEKEMSAFHSTDRKNLPPLPISRQETFDSISDEKSAATPPPKRYIFGLTRIPFYLILAGLAILALAGSGVGLGLSLSRSKSTSTSSAPSNSTSEPASSPTSSPSASPSTTSNSTVGDTTDCSTTPILFRATAPTDWGENIFMAGNVSSIGSWDPAKAFELSSDNYTQINPLWFASIDLENGDGKGATIAYKYVRKEPGGSFIWETKNRTVTVGRREGCVDGSGQSTVKGGGGPSKTVDDVWTGPGAGLTRRKGRRRSFWARD